MIVTFGCLDTILMCNMLKCKSYHIDWRWFKRLNTNLKLIQGQIWHVISLSSILCQPFKNNYCSAVQCLIKPTGFNWSKVKTKYIHICNKDTQWIFLYQLKSFYFIFHKEPLVYGQIIVEGNVDVGLFQGQLI